MSSFDLKKKREEFNLTQLQLAEMLQLSRKTINSYENGSNIPPSKLILLEQFFKNLEEKIKKNEKIEDFLEFEDDALPQTINSVSELKTFLKKKKKADYVIPLPEDDYMMVEYVDLETAAGKLGGHTFDDIPETHRKLVPKEYDKGHYLVVRVCGNSMDDGTKRCLSDGDEILVRLWTELIQYLPIKNKLFLVNTQDGSVVKQITNIDYDNKTIMLHSFNPNFEDYEVDFEEIIQIFTVEKIVSSKIVF